MKGDRTWEKIVFDFGYHRACHRSTAAAEGGFEKGIFVGEERALSLGKRVGPREIIFIRKCLISSVKYID